MHQWQLFAVQERPASEEKFANAKPESSPLRSAPAHLNWDATRPMASLFAKCALPEKGHGLLGLHVYEAWCHRIGVLRSRGETRVRPFEHSDGARTHALPR